jgi:hypothetical protein
VSSTEVDVAVINRGGGQFIYQWLKCQRPPALVVREYPEKYGPLTLEERVEILEMRLDGKLPA